MAQCKAQRWRRPCKAHSHRQILPLLNGDKPGEQQAAAEALAKFNMRDVAAVLQSTLPPAPSRYRYDERYARASF